VQCMRIQQNILSWLRTKIWKGGKTENKDTKKNSISFGQSTWKSMAAIVPAKLETGRPVLFPFLYSIADEGNGSEIVLRRENSWRKSSGFRTTLPCPDNK